MRTQYARCTARSWRAERDPASQTSSSASLLALVQRLEVEKRHAMADVVRALISPSP
jgi:hypothetical protein